MKGLLPPIAIIHKQILRLDPFWWTKINQLSPTLSRHHSNVCDRIPKEGETTVLIHILNVFWRGFRHASLQCFSKHSSFPRYNVCGEWAQFCWTQMPSVIWVALGYLRNPKGTVTQEIYIYALPDTQVIVNGKPEVIWGTLGCLRWCWTKGNKHSFGTWKIMIRYKEKNINYKDGHTLEQVAQRWDLHPWRSSRVDWTQPWPTWCNQYCLEQGVELKTAGGPFQPKSCLDILQTSLLAVEISITSSKQAEHQPFFMSPCTSTWIPVPKKGLRLQSRSASPLLKLLHLRGWNARLELTNTKDPLKHIKRI